MYIILLDYKYLCIPVYITLMLQHIKVDLTVSTSYTAGWPMKLYLNLFVHNNIIVFILMDREIDI